MERFSKNRQAILECLHGTTSHPSAEWIYAQLKPRYPSLSLGTVYRNLCQLKEAGKVQSIGVVAGQEHFDGNIRPHAHVICVRCGSVVDLDDAPAYAAAMHAAEKASGFIITSPQLVGVCPACRAAEEN